MHGETLKNASGSPNDRHNDARNMLS